MQVHSLVLWYDCINAGNCDIFSNLVDSVNDVSKTDFYPLLQSAADLLTALKERFASDFKEDYSSFLRVQDPVCTAEVGTRNAGTVY